MSTLFEEEWRQLMDQKLTRLEASCNQGDQRSRMGLQNLLGDEHYRQTNRFHSDFHRRTTRILCPHPRGQSAEREGRSPDLIFLRHQRLHCPQHAVTQRVGMVRPFGI